MDDPAVEKKKEKQQQEHVLFPDVPRRKRTPARRAGPGTPDRRCSPQLPSPSSAPGGVFPYLAVPRRKRTPSRRARVHAQGSSPISSPSETDCSSITRWPLFCESIPLSEYRIPGDIVDFAEEEVFSVSDLMEFLALDGLDGEEPPALCLFREALSDYVIPGPLPDLEDDEDYVHQGFSLLGRPRPPCPTTQVGRTGDGKDADGS